MVCKNRKIQYVVIAIDVLLIVLAVSLFHGEKIGRTMMISFFCLWVASTSHVWTYFMNTDKTRSKKLLIIHYVYYAMIVLVTYGGVFR